MLIQNGGTGLSVQSLNNLALSYSAAQQWSAAVRSYKLAWRMLEGESRSTRASLLLNLGNAFVEGRQLAEAISTYRHLLHLSPAYAVGYYSLARALDRARAWDAAEAGYQESLRLNPRLLNAYSNLGVLYLNKRDPARAVVALESAVALGGGAADFNNLGDAYGDSGRYEEAVRAYNEALDASERLSGTRFYPKALYSLLHYLIHTCDFGSLPLPALPAPSPGASTLVPVPLRLSATCPLPSPPCPTPAPALIHPHPRSRPHPRSHPCLRCSPRRPSRSRPPLR